MLWNAFIHISPKTYKVKLAIGLLSFFQTTLFQALTSYLIDPRYNGYEIGDLFVLLKGFFAGVTHYFLWSLVHRKYELLDTLGSQTYQTTFSLYKEKLMKEEPKQKKVRFEGDTSDSSSDDDCKEPLEQRQLESIGLSMGDMYRLGLL